MDKNNQRGKHNVLSTQLRKLPNSKLFEERMIGRGHNFTLLEQSLPSKFWGNKLQKLANQDQINLRLYYDVFESLKLQGIKNLYRYISLHLKEDTNNQLFHFKKIERIFNLEQAKERFLNDMESYVDKNDYRNLLVVYEEYFVPK